MLSGLFIGALWSPEGKGLTSWLLFVMFIMIFGIREQVWYMYLIVSIPDPCCLSYLNEHVNFVNIINGNFSSGNYRGFKLTEQAIKILERIVDGLIRQVVSFKRLPVWPCHRKRHYRCNLCGPATAGETPSSEQEALYGLRGPRESI